MAAKTKTPAQPVSAEGQLAELRAAVGAAGVRRRETDDRLAGAERAALALRDQRVLALSHNDEREAAKLAERIANAERELADELRPRADAAALAVRHAETEVKTFEADNWRSIMAERAEEDVAARDRLATAYAEIVAAARHWQERAAANAALAAAAPDADPRAIHSLPTPASDVARDARRVLAAGALPTPTLGARAVGWSIPATDSPDDDIREAARAAAR